MTFKENMVYEYTGIDCLKQQELDMVKWLQYARDAYISRLNKSEEGRDYLEECWISEQTEPDRDMLRAEFDIREV